MLQQQILPKCTPLYPINLTFWDKLYLLYANMALPANTFLKVNVQCSHCLKNQQCS